MAALLAFDTSTEQIAAALVQGEHCRTRTAPGGARASATLIALLQDLLAAEGLAPGALDAIAFGRGPGAFTGLRTACAVAQGYAFGLARPVLALDTLQAVAEDACLASGADDVCVAMDARMGAIYAARYRREAGAWRTLHAPALLDPGALAARCADEALPQALAGSALAPSFGVDWSRGLGVAVRLPAAWPAPAALATLARAAWAAGECLDAAQALPLYLRDKVALTTDERAAARAAQDAPA